ADGSGEPGHCKDDMQVAPEAVLEPQALAKLRGEDEEHKASERDPTGGDLQRRFARVERSDLVAVAEEEDRPVSEDNRQRTERQDAVEVVENVDAEGMGRSPKARGQRELRSDHRHAGK